MTEASARTAFTPTKIPVLPVVERRGRRPRYTTVSISPETLAKLSALAARTGQTRAFIVAYLVEHATADTDPVKGTR